MQSSFGRYELLQPIASGGTAEVFLARVRGGKSRVALKRLHRHLRDVPVAVDSVRQEGMLLQQMSHPGLPRGVDAGQVEGQWFVVMEWLDGTSLRQLAPDRYPPPVPLDIAVNIVARVAEALDYAHRVTDHAGVPLELVHRDVTPHNIMVTTGGDVKLIDFGLAWTVNHRGEVSGTAKGTLSYMAPEQVCDDRVDARADVFALGVVLYELTTRSRLYTGSPVDIMTAVVERDAKPPSALAAHYPASLERSVLGALKRDRGERTPDAASLARSLDEYAREVGSDGGRIGIRRLLAG